MNSVPTSLSPSIKPSPTRRRLLPELSSFCRLFPAGSLFVLWSAGADRSFLFDFLYFTVYDLNPFYPIDSHIISIRTRAGESLNGILRQRFTQHFPFVLEFLSISRSSTFDCTISQPSLVARQNRSVKFAQVSSNLLKLHLVVLPNWRTFLRKPLHESRTLRTRSNYESLAKNREKTKRCSLERVKKILTPLRRFSLR